MKKVLELVREAIFRSFLTRHLNIISPPKPDGKLQDRYAPGYNALIIPKTMFSDAAMSGSITLYFQRGKIVESELSNFNRLFEVPHILSTAVSGLPGKLSVANFRINSCDG
jgi:hypothetical protein